MADEIKRLLAIKDASGNFVLDADEVAELTGKKRNAVYESRKNDCKLDKLAIFEKVKQIVDAGEKDVTKLAGDKNGVLNGIDGVLKDGARYEITIREVK